MLHVKGWGWLEGDTKFKPEAYCKFKPKAYLVYYSHSVSIPAVFPNKWVKLCGSVEGHITIVMCQDYCAHIIPLVVKY